MLKYILFIALVSAAEEAIKTNSTDKTMKPGDLDGHYVIDFEQDPDHIDDDEDDSEIMDNLPEFNENGFMNMLQDVNSCGVQIIYKYNISAEVKHVYDQVVHPEVLAELENNEDEELKESALYSYAKLSYELSQFPFNDAIRSFEEYLNKYPGSPNFAEANEYLVSVYFTTKKNISLKYNHFIPFAFMVHFTLS